MGAIFSCFWALTGAQTPSEEQFRVSRNGYRFIKRGGPQHDSNHPEQYFGKCSENAMLGLLRVFLSSNRGPRGPRFVFKALLEWMRGGCM